METSRSSRIIAWFTGPVPTSVILAFAIGALFILAAGSNPLEGYSSMFTGSFGSAIGFANTVQRAIPLIGMALAVAVAFRAGIINLGVEGQMVLGGLAGGIVALYLPGPGPVVMIVACLVGAAVGAFWGAIAALLQLWPGVPLLITSLLLNYPARYLASWLVRFPLKDPESSQVATETFDPGAQIPLIAAPSSSLGQTMLDAFGKDSLLTTLGRTVNWSVVVVIILVLAVYFINTRTVFGFESGMHGHNPLFARYSGVHTGGLMVSTTMFSGAIAGLIGVMFTIGAPSVRIVDGQLIDTNYAWTGLLVALLAMYRPFGVALAGLFFAGIIAGSGAMGRDLSMSPQIAAVIQGIVIILIAFQVRLPASRRRQAEEAEDRSEHDQAEEEVGKV